MRSLFVDFRIADIIHPEPAEVLRQLYEHNGLSGEVIAVTDDGDCPEQFVVVRVANLPEPVIVPACSARPREVSAGTLDAHDADANHGDACDELHVVQRVGRDSLTMVPTDSNLF